MHILILDADTLVAGVFREALEDAGHTVLVTHDNDSAVEALFDGDYDLVVADLMIGSETSIPTLDCARAFCPGAEIILVTGSSLFPNGELHYAISDVAYRLQKPVMVDELAALVAHCDRARRRSRQPDTGGMAAAG